MMRKAAKKHLKTISNIRSFLQCHRERLDRALRERPAAQAVDDLGYLPLVDHLDAELAAVERALFEAETAYQCTQRDLTAYRRLHHRNSDHLFRLQCDVKQLLTGLLPSGLEGTDIAGATPRATRALENQVRHTIFLLREIDRMEPPLIAGVSVQAAAFADKLQTALGKLRASDTDLFQAEGSTAASLAIADAAVAEAGRVVSWVMRCVEGLSGLAGYGGSVGRIRGRSTRSG